MATKISIIDDDRAVREATKDLLRSLGYAAEAFDSAETFIAKGDFAETSCILADIQMPGMDGVALQAFLVECGHALPMIFITAFPDEGVKQRVLASGAYGYLVKPFDESRLLDCINNAIAH
ncbi:MAG: response regulator [Pseudorhodoplanes sp.]|nr:response regulator [Pseudorhodoplanes sp.]